MKKISKSIRKYVRKEKARIRREFLGKKEQEEKLKELMEKLSRMRLDNFRDGLTEGIGVDKVADKTK